MAQSDQETREAAKFFAQKYGANALSEAHKMLQHAIQQRHAEAISYWGALIAVLKETYVHPKMRYEPH